MADIDWSDTDLGELRDSFWRGDDVTLHDVIPDKDRQAIVGLSDDARRSIIAALQMAYIQGFEDASDTHDVAGLCDDYALAFAAFHFPWLYPPEAE